MSHARPCYCGRWERPQNLVAGLPLWATSSGDDPVLHAHGEWPEP